MASTHKSCPDLTSQNIPQSVRFAIDHTTLLVMLYGVQNPHDAAELVDVSRQQLGKSSTVLYSRTSFCFFLAHEAKIRSMSGSILRVVICVISHALCCLVTPALLQGCIWIPRHNPSPVLDMMLLCTPVSSECFKASGCPVVRVSGKQTPLSVPALHSVCMGA